MNALAGKPGPVPPAAQTPGAGAADAAGGLGFPDMPRLELDELLVQLVDRAGDVLAAQGRLRGLLRANALVAGDLSLPVVLRQIVGAPGIFSAPGTRRSACSAATGSLSSSCTSAWTTPWWRRSATCPAAGGSWAC